MDSRPCSVLLVLILAVSPLTAAGPSKKPFSTERAPDAPDPQLAKARIARTVQWYRKNMRAAYEASGNRNAKWDAAVVEALDAMADLWSHNPQRSGNEQERAWRASQKAVTAGCDDPLLLFVYAYSYEVVALESTEEAVRLYTEAASTIDATKYSPALQAQAHLRAASSMITNALLKKSTSARGVRGQLEPARELLSAVAQAPDAPEAVVLDLVAGILDADRMMGADRQEGFDAIFPLFEKARPANDVLLPLLRARFLIDYAWDARGGSAASELTDNTVDVFLARAGEAGRSVAKALAVDPFSPAIAPLMLSIELAQGKGRERMESWFRYGVAVDPGNEELYFAKLHYLEPRWHGGRGEMAEFGREALSTKQWALRTPLIIVNAHAYLAGEFEDPGQYFRETPLACREIKAAYEPYLELYPESNYDRSGYAMLLYQCGDFAGAHRQFQALGSDARLGPFFTRANYENKRLDSAARATSKRP